MRRRNQIKIKQILILSIIFMVVLGYAYLNSNLTIIGHAGINKNTWDIHWDDESINVSSESVTSPTPTVNNTKDTVSFAPSLNLPGEFYEFSIDAVNAGTIDGIISNIEIKYYNADTLEEIDLPYYLDCSITNEDDTELSEDQVIRKQTSKKYKIRIEYKNNIKEEDLNNVVENIDAKVIMDQEQSTGNATPVTDTYVRELCNNTATYNRDITYLVGKVEDLVCLSKVVSEGTTFSGATINQVKNIDFNQRTSYVKSKDTSYGDINGNGITETLIEEVTTEKGFKPIGNNTKKFQGTYNGGEYTISNLYINRPEEDYIGLFGYSEGIISNLNIKTATIQAKHYVGSLVAYTTNKVENIKAENIELTASDKSAGGIVGCSYSNIENIEIKDSNITSTAYHLGGIVGWIEGSFDNVELENITINGSSNNVGGVAGYQNSSSSYITNLKINGLEVKGTANYVGGIYGYTNGSITKQINNIENLKVSGTNKVGGLAGGSYSGNVKIETIEMKDTIEVSGNEYVGGVLGFIDGINIINEIKLNTKVTGTSSVGGVLGKNPIRYGDQSYITNVVGKVEVTGTTENSSYIGGIVGYSEGGYVNGVILEEGSSSLRTITGYKNYGGVYKSYYIDGFTQTLDDQGTKWDISSKNINAYENAIDTIIGGDNDGTGYYFDFGEDNEIHLVSVEEKPIEFTLSGAGIESDPYLIHNVKEWNEATTKAQQVGVYFKIVNDIDFTNKEFRKMGSSLNPFKGTLDGDNHTISGISMIGGSYTSLFGYAENPAIVKNLKVEDIEIEKAATTSGILFGYTKNITIDNVDLKNSTIEGTINNIGGVAGSSDGTNTLTNLKINGVEITGTANNVGGIYGYLGGTLTKQINNIENLKVSGTNRVGGLAGGSYSSNVKIEEIEMKDTIEVSGNEYVGGVLGFIDSVNTINEIKLNTKVTGTSGVGGVLGKNATRLGEKNYISNIVGNVEVTGTTENSSYIGGVVGYSEGGYVNGVILEEGSSSSRTIAGYVNYGGIFNTYYINGFTQTINDQGTKWDVSSKNLNAYETALDTKIGGDNDGSGYYFDFGEDNEIHLVSVEDKPIEFTLSGTGTESDPYLIHNVKEWNEATTKVQQVGVYFKIVNDIDFTNKEFRKMGSPINTFKGTLDGDNHTISGMSLIGGSYQAVFGQMTNTATVKDLKIENCKLEKVSTYGGILTGYSNSTTIDNVTIKNSRINALLKYIGGLSGYQYNENIITNLKIDGIEITGTADYVGGIYGESYGNLTKQIRNIENLKVSGNDYIGGLIGNISESLSKIETIDIKDTIEVSGNEYVGGILGYNRATVNEVVFNAKVTGNNAVGGVCGQNQGKYFLIQGGIGKITNVVGKVTSNKSGILGSNSHGSMDNAIIEEGSADVAFGSGGTNIYYIDGYTANTYQGTKWDAQYLHDMTKYSEVVETATTGDLDGTGYYFGYDSTNNRTCLVKAN